MPIVPRNTPNQTRINPLPGVGTVNPQGAEGLGSVAAAVGRQADTIGERVNVIGREGQAWQNVTEAVGRDAMTMQRIQDLQDQKPIIDAESALKTHLVNTTVGHQDAATGQFVPGTLDAPYVPKAEGVEESNPYQATNQAYKAWMENKDGPFAKLSPRAQEAFKRRATEIFLPFQEQALKKTSAAIKAANAQRADNATKASETVVANAAASLNPVVWDHVNHSEAVQLAIHDPEVQSTIVNIGETDPAKLRFYSPAGQSLYNQKYTAAIAKNAGIHVTTLLSMADAIPVGTPEADAQAKKLVDFAQGFTKDNPAFTPEQVAQHQKDAQTITAARIQRTNSFEAQKEKTQDEAIVNFASGRDPDAAHLKPLFDNATPARRIAMTQALVDHKETAEIKDIDTGYDRFYLSPHSPADVTAFKTLIDSTQSVSARARGQKLLNDFTAGIRKQQDETQKQEAASVRSLSKAQLAGGLAEDDKGNIVPASEKVQIDYARKLLREGKITDADYDAKMKDIATGKTQKQAVVAARSLKAVSTLMNIKNPERFFVFKDGQFARTPEGMKTERKLGTWEDPVIPGLYRPGMVTKDVARGTVHWGEGGLREKYEALKDLASHPVRNVVMGSPVIMGVTGGGLVPNAINVLSAKTTELSSELVVQALNAAVEWESLPDTGKPTTMEEHIANALNPETNGTVKEFNAKVFALHMLEHEGMVSDLLNAQKEQTYKAFAEGLKKRGNSATEEGQQ